MIAHRSKLKELFFSTSVETNSYRLQYKLSRKTEEEKQSGFMNDSLTYPETIFLLIFNVIHTKYLFSDRPSPVMHVSKTVLGNTFCRSTIEMAWLHFSTGGLKKKKKKKKNGG